MQSVASCYTMVPKMCKILIHHFSDVQTLSWSLICTTKYQRFNLFVELPNIFAWWEWILHKQNKTHQVCLNIFFLLVSWSWWISTTVYPYTPQQYDNVGIATLFNRLHKPFTASLHSKFSWKQSNHDIQFDGNKREIIFIFWEKNPFLTFHLKLTKNKLLSVFDDKDFN